MAIYLEAFRHGSAMRHQNGPKIVQTNERLEFLGDALLDAIVADVLFKKFPKEQEGFLTEMRSRVVNRSQISAMANRLGIVELMDYHADIRLNYQAKKVIEGNALEALIGAVYMDKGYKACYQFVSQRLIGQYLDLDTLMNTRISHKAEFLKWCQKNKLILNWEHLEEDDGKRKLHLITLLVNEEPWFTEKNHSRKNAEELCCEKALRKVEGLNP